MKSRYPDLSQRQMFLPLLEKKVVPRTYSIRPFMAIGVFLFLQKEKQLIGGKNDGREFVDAD
ncbi:hypothetical protein UB32_08840 [Mesobacillus subterraneus]|uniref:Uncharacterized protein n=1 Tax=Mesobacillus subterraneus TaxID=285983 RepID=A0A0D6ZCT2_9BACI|nr:hypothetical protein UB32_08840 [Mesobacillus subterraneus]